MRRRFCWRLLRCQIMRVIGYLSGGVSLACLLFGDCRAAAPQIFVAPDTDLAQLAASSPAGASFVLLPGKHYGGNIIPKDHQSFEGQPGAILSGAIRLGPFSKTGQFWKGSAPNPLPISHGSCDHRGGVIGDSCLLREDLFVDEVPLKRALVIGQLREGTWYQFRETGDVLLPFDPTGRLVEMSYRSSAFSGPGRNVSIRHITIEQYASVAQHGAIEGISGSNWIVSDNVVRFNSGTGIRTGAAMRVQSNLATSNGQLGIGGSGDNLSVEGNEIDSNNTHGFDPGWEAGATKFWRTNGLMFVRNCVQDNAGHGIWTDIDNRNASIIGNSAINNSGVGIFHEISGHAFIADNLSALNGSREDSPWGSQILISGSIDSIVWRNRIEVAPNYGHGIFIVQEGRANDAKIISDLPYYDARSNLILGNTIKFLGNSGTLGFYSRKWHSAALISTNSFEDNTIIVADDRRRRFKFGSDFLDLPEAQSQGQERGSRVIVEATDGARQHSRPKCSRENPSE